MGGALCRDENTRPRPVKDASVASRSREQFQYHTLSFNLKSDDKVRKGWAQPRYRMPW